MTEFETRNDYLRTINEYLNISDETFKEYRIDLYKSISYLCPLPLNNILRYISKKRQAASIKENQVLGLTIVINLLSEYNNKLNDEIELLFKKICLSDREFGVFKLLFNKCLSISLYKRMICLMQGSWDKVEEIDKNDYEFQRMFFPIPASEELFNKWLYVQSLLYFSYVSKVHFLTCNIIKKYNDERPINDYNKTQFLKYYNENNDLQSILIIDEFKVLVEYAGYLLNYTYSCSHFISKCKVIGFDYFAALKRMVIESQYVAKYPYSYIEENYIYGGYFDEINSCMSNMHVVNIITSITNNVLFNYAEMNEWSDHIQFCESYIQSFIVYFAKHRKDIIEELVETKSDEVKELSKQSFENGDEEIESENEEDEREIKIQIDNDDEESVEDKIIKMDLDKNLFDFLAKNK